MFHVRLIFTESNTVVERTFNNRAEADAYIKEMSGIYSEMAHNFFIENEVEIAEVILDN